MSLQRHWGKKKSRAAAVLKGYLIYSAVTLMYLEGALGCRRLLFSLRMMRLGREIAVKVLVDWVCLI